METKVNQEEVVALINKACDHKRIMIVHVTAPNSDADFHTTSLAVHMDKYTKEHHMNVTIELNSASKINEIGKEIDILLLTPELFAMEEEVKKTYPDKVVKVIDQKDYGFKNAENIIKVALS